MQGHAAPLALTLLTLAVSACAGAPARVLHETKRSAPRSYERPLHRDRPFEVTRSLEDGALRVHVLQGPCVTTTETFTRVQEVTVLEGQRIEGDFKESVERTDSAPHPCSKGPEGLEVRLMLPHGRPVLARVDRKGDAFLPLPDALLERLSRSAHGVLSVLRTRVDVPLEPAFVQYLERARVDFGEVAVSELVASSGRLSTREVMLEVAVAPRNARDQFAGAFLPESAFRFDDVELLPVQGGAPVPLTVDVERVEVMRAGEGQLNVALVLDSSGSMKENDPQREGRIRGGEAVAREVIKGGSVAVLDFGVSTSSGLREARLMQDFTSDASLLSGALRRVGEQGGTNLYAAIKDALALLEQRGPGGAVVALTDGEAQDSALHREVIELAQRRGVALYAVGLGSTVDFADLRHLGLATGGAFAEARDAARLASAFRGIGVGLAYGRVLVRGRGALPTGRAAAGRYRLRGKLVIAEPGNKRALADAFDTLAVLDDAALGASQLTLAAGGGCNPDCYYDATCSVVAQGGGKCCDPVDNSLYGRLFAEQCRTQDRLSSP